MRDIVPQYLKLTVMAIAYILKTSVTQILNTEIIIIFSYLLESRTDVHTLH